MAIVNKGKEKVPMNWYFIPASRNSTFRDSLTLKKGD